jgi:1-acyl-sn-glycerol-3-phosphate acyltransferase
LQSEYPFNKNNIRKLNPFLYFYLYLNLPKKVTRKLFYILYQPYKWLFFLPFLAINTLFFGIVAVLVSTFLNQRTGSYLGGVIWSRINACLTPMIVRVKGRENIKKNDSYVVISNHQSYYDIFVIYGWLGIDIKWVMKKELAKIPGLGFGSKKVGHIFLDRSNKRTAIESLNEAKKKLTKGTSVVIFPEGTRSTTGQLGRFKRGAFRLALDLDLPILPITISGTRRILPAGTFNILPGKVNMIIHEPISTQNYSGELLPELILKTSQIISSGLR